MGRSGAFQCSLDRCAWLHRPWLAVAGAFPPSRAHLRTAPGGVWSHVISGRTERIHVQDKARVGHRRHDLRRVVRRRNRATQEDWRAPRQILAASCGAPRRWDYGGSRCSVLPRLCAFAPASLLGPPERRPIFVGGSPRAKDAAPRGAAPGANGLSGRACPARPDDARDDNYQEGLRGIWHLRRGRVSSRDCMHPAYPCSYPDHQYWS